MMATAQEHILWTAPHARNSKSNQSKAMTHDVTVFDVRISY